MADSPLTIGMAAYDDAAGVYFTLRSLVDHHPRVPMIVIDTTPKPCRRTRGAALACGAQYFHRPDLRGTAAPRDAVFRLAKTPWVMCIDSHVVMPDGVVQAAIDYAADNPESIDLIQGPLVGDDSASLSTHWRQTTPPGLWGTWDCDPQVTNDKLFEIHAQGLGQFMMRRAVWPGFHPLHRGFGAEEGYIHEKVRQRGGKTLCHPGLGWHHWFRDMENGAPPPPYPLRTEDILWNLLVTHRAVGIEADEVIRQDFGKDIPLDRWDALANEARAAQTLGSELPAPPRLKILGIWYSNNAAPPTLMVNSLRTIHTAKSSTTRHDVEVRTCSWEPVRGNPFPWICAARTAQPGHATILEQQRQCVAEAKGFEWDVICFLEHDTLYPADYFDRVGNAFAANPDTPVVSNLDYEGLNETGWLSVTERHEPMHQLAMRRDIAERNFERCQADCDRHGWCYLEPQGDRANWVQIPPSSGRDITMPSIHVNFAGRFTSHGEVCYEKTARTTQHVYWGKVQDWWPGTVTPVSAAATGLAVQPPPCGSCGGSAAYATPLEWLVAAAKPDAAPDCWEHLSAVRDLAGKCEHVTELNIWGSPWLAALLAGAKTEVVSVAPGPMANWDIAKRILKNSGQSAPTLNTRMHDSVAVALDPTDLLLIDTQHTGRQLLSELTAHAPKVRRYIVLHDTQVFGEIGDDGGPGLLPAIRGWVRQFPEWSVVSHTDSNNGLTVLSKDPADKPAIQAGAWQQFGNFVAAMTKHMALGGAVADEPVVQRRLDTCALCPLRSGTRCTKCGCELESNPLGGPGKAFLPGEQCPVGKW